MMFGVAILAAGASTRMGSPKLTLRWGATSILGHLISTWQSLENAGVRQIAVVCATTNASVTLELDRLGVPPANRIINPAPERGMFSSIQAAGAWEGWMAELTHIAMALGDQPETGASSLRMLLEHAREHPGRICQPAFRGRPRHPVIFPRSDFVKISLSGAGSLREHLLGADVSLAPMNDSSLERDLDFPEDYCRAVARRVRSAGGGEGAGMADPH